MRADPATIRGVIRARLERLEPFDFAGLLRFLGTRAVAGVEEVAGATYRRTLRLPGGPAVVELSDDGSAVRCVMRLADPADEPAAIARARHILDLDCDPAAVDADLRRDAVLRPLVERRGGIRIPGCGSGAELAVRAVLGQQISVAGARTIAGRLAAEYGERVPWSEGALTHVFPAPEALVDAAPSLPMPEARRRAVRSLASALAAGDLDLDARSGAPDVTAALLALPGIGPWTASYVAMRALGDRDAFMATDLGVRHAARALGLPQRAGDLERHAERWSPWRAYATLHLWHSLAP